METVKLEPPAMTEFYLTTLWTYTTKAVEEIIHEMEEAKFDRAEFIYDREYSWFKVSCRQDEEHAIRLQFCTLARGFEDEAFGDSEDDLLSLDGFLEPSPENEWFSQDAVSSDVGEVDELYCRPRALTNYPYVKLWDDLDKGNEPYACWEIMTPDQAMIVGAELGIKLSASGPGKLVFIAGHKREPINEAMERLKVMLTTRKLLSPPRSADHIVYAEDSICPVSPGLTADIRYLTNIDPKLTCSTLIDRLLVENLADSYETLYREASSIRICLWNSNQQHYMSFFGPKVTTRPRDKTALGNRPAILTRMIEKYAPAERPDFPAEGQVSGVSCQVGTWVETVPVFDESVGRAAHYLLDTGSQEVAESSKVPGHEDLMDFNDDETTLRAESPTVATPGTTTGRPGLTSANARMPASRQTPSALQAQLGTSSAKEIISRQSNGLWFAGDDSLIDMLAAVDTRSAEDTPRSTINWGMPPLIPLPIDTLAVVADSSTPNRNLTSTPPMRREARQPRTSGENNPDKEISIGKHTAARQVGGNSTSQSHGLTNPSAQLSQRPAPRPRTGVLGYLPVTEDFVDEIHEEIATLLSSGPYRRGKVEVRAELGRIILERVERSGLAFNNESEKSDGWEKAMLLERLKADFKRDQDIHFTKILTAYAPNIEDMINTEAEGARIWEHKPTCASTTYSFHFGSRSEKDLSPFIVDIKDDGTLCTELSYSIRLRHNVPAWDKPMPIYVHAICRHWDLRIVTCHTKTDEVDATYGPFARDLMQSLSILRNENGALELQFAVPTVSLADLMEVRVLTKWRYASVDHKSALEVTEVQQMKTEPYSEGPYSKASWNSYEGKRSRPWSNRMTKDSKGEVARWYEAAVISAELEDLCQQNASLNIGVKADWDVEKLEARGVFSTLYGPALQMVRAMDHVGRLDDNNLSQTNGHLLLEHNKPLSQVVGSVVSEKGKQRAQ